MSRYYKQPQLTPIPNFLGLMPEGDEIDEYSCNKLQGAWISDLYFEKLNDELKSGKSESITKNLQDIKAYKEDPGAEGYWIDIDQILSIEEALKNNNTYSHSVTEVSKKPVVTSKILPSVTKPATQKAKETKIEKVPSYLDASNPINAWLDKRTSHRKKD